MQGGLRLLRPELHAHFGIRRKSPLEMVAGPGDLPEHRMQLFEAEMAMHAERSMVSLLPFDERGNLQTEVCLLQPLVAEQVPALALQHDATVLQHLAAMRQGKRVAHVLLHQQHRHPALVDRGDGLEYLRDQRIGN